MNVVTAVANDADFTRTKFLVVDSTPLFRDMAHAALTHLRTREVKHAPDIQEAVTALKRFGSQIGGLVCDWDTVPVGGLELLRMIRSATMTKVSPRMCAVILTGRVDAAAMRAAMLLDVNGVAIAPLSQEKLVKTIGNAMTRSWTLKTPEQYLAVNVVEAPAVEPAHAVSSAAGSSGKEVWRRDADTTGGHASNSVGSPAPKPHAQDLQNVRMCTLSDVKPADVKSGVVLARDLKDRDGHLLLKSGTDLTTALLTRLQSVAEGHADSYHVWIGERRT